MKKILLFLFVLISSILHAQTIGTFSSIPTNPTTADSVYILVDCHFTSGGCGAHTQGQSINGNSIGTWALHCLGPLAVLCTHTDTFSLGMLAAGSYTFNFQLDEGFGGPPCTPGIVPGPSDSYNFTVSVPTSVNEIESREFTIYPNPAAGELKIKSEKLKIEKIDIYNALGQQVFSQKLTASSKEQIAVDVSALSPGMYIVELNSEGKLSRKIFSVLR